MLSFHPITLLALFVRKNSDVNGMYSDPKHKFPYIQFPYVYLGNFISWLSQFHNFSPRDKLLMYPEVAMNTWLL